MKTIKIILSVLCALSMAISMAVLPAQASETVDGSWEVITDDCTTKEHFASEGGGTSVVVNETNGFVWLKRAYPYVGHAVYINPESNDDFEITSDLFINDIDNDITGTSYDSMAFRTYLYKGSTLVNQTYHGPTWVSEISDDAGNKYKMKEYALASRKFATTEVTGPTHLNLKIELKDGQYAYYIKWNTEENWIKKAGFAVSDYRLGDPLKVKIDDTQFVAFDNLTIKRRTWGTIWSSDGTNSSHTGGGNSSIAINTDEGFLYRSGSANSLDHYLGIDSTVNGDFEMTFDYFVNDIDLKETLDESIGTEDAPKTNWDDGNFRWMITDGLSTSANIYLHEAYYNGWNENVAHSNGTSYNLKEYALASRVYSDEALADGAPTHIDMKLRVESGVAKIYRKWDTDTDYSLWKEQTLNANYLNADRLVLKLAGRWATAVDNVRVTAPEYEDGLIPGMQVGDMISTNPLLATYNTTGGSITDYFNYDYFYGVLDGLHDDFIVSTDMILTDAVGELGIYFGADADKMIGKGFSHTDDNLKLFDGFINIVGGKADLGKRVMTANFVTASTQGAAFSTDPTWKRYGTRRSNGGETDFIANHTYRIVISCIDGYLKVGLKDITDGVNENWQMFELDKGLPGNVGQLVLYNFGYKISMTGTDHPTDKRYWPRWKLWTNASAYAEEASIVNADGTITATANVSNYTDSDSPQTMVTAIYEINNGEERLKNVSLSNDITGTNNVKTLTGSIDIPNDEKEYIARAFVWNIDSLVPFCEYSEITISE